MTKQLAWVKDRYETFGCKTAASFLRRSLAIRIGEEINPRLPTSDVLHKLRKFFLVIRLGRDRSGNIRFTRSKWDAWEYYQIGYVLLPIGSSIELVRAAVADVVAKLDRATSEQRRSKK